MNKKALAVFMVSVFVVSMAVYAVSGTDKSEAADSQTIIVETSPDFAPYDYYYGTEFAGIDLDILRAVSMDTGLNIQFRQNSFDSIILSVTQGKCDFGASGFTISEERKKSVDFTDSYAVIKQVVVAKVGLDIKTEADLEGKVIAAQTGTSGADYAEGIKDSAMDFQKGYPEIVLDLLNDKAYCEIVDDAVAKAQVSSYEGQLQIYDVLNAEPEYYGFVFAKDSPLYDTVNNSLKKLKEDGTVDKISQYYADNGYSPNTPSYYNQEPTLYILTGTDSPYGYEYNGKDAGVEIDVLTAVAKNAGMRVSVITSDEGSAKSDWLNRIIETPSFVGAAGFSTGSDIGSGLVFTDSYMSDSLTLLVPKDSGINDPAGKKVAVVSYSAADDYLAGKGATTLVCENSVQLSNKLISGDADCAVVSSIVAKSCMTQNPGKFDSVEISGTESSIAFVCSADASSLVDKINTALKQLKEDGTLEKIQKHYSDKGYSLSVSSYYDDSSSKGFWQSLFDKFDKDFLQKERYQYIVKGLGNTLAITALALVIGTVIGVLAAAVMSVNAISGRLKIPNAICKVYVTVIRGTPMMVQLLIIYYVIFATASLNQILIAAVAFGLNSGAYVAEIVRSGINSVPKGQMEAARSLGLDMRTSMVSVVVPQAIRNILPALGNEGISLIKETSIAGYIGIMELTRGADIIRGQTYDALLPLLVIAIIYLAIVLVLQHFIKKLERRLNSAY